jgi:hypothetical protein
VSTILVLGCKVTVDEPVGVVDVTLHLPKEDWLSFPIIPPFADPAGLAI